jgi:hypothetical protein
MEQEDQQLESLKYIETSLSPPNENAVDLPAQAKNPIVIEDQQAVSSRVHFP